MVPPFFWKFKKHSNFEIYSRQPSNPRKLQKVGKRRYTRCTQIRRMSTFNRKNKGKQIFQNLKPFFQQIHPQKLEMKKFLNEIDNKLKQSCWYNLLEKSFEILNFN